MPAMMASNTQSSSPCTLRMITLVRGFRVWISRVACTPLMTGMRRSSSAMSGLSLRARSTASCRPRLPPPPRSPGRGAQEAQRLPKKAMVIGNQQSDHGPACQHGCGSIGRPLWVSTRSFGSLPVLRGPGQNKPHGKPANRRSQRPTSAWFMPCGTGESTLGEPVQLAISPSAEIGACPRIGQAPRGDYSIASHRSQSSIGEA